MKHIKIFAGMIFSLLIVFGFSFTVNAANGVEINEDEVKVPYLGANVVNIDYSGNFSDLFVVVADPTLASYSLTDNGNGKATLVIGGSGFGKTVVAVSKYSNALAVDYLIASVGMSKKNVINNYVLGNYIYTVYDDCVIKYNYVLNGTNSSMATILGVVRNRENGFDEIKVKVNSIKDDALFPGLSTYSASFYDVSNKLIKTQKAYIRSNLGIESNISWYIPENCVKIVLN